MSSGGRAPAATVHRLIAPRGRSMWLSSSSAARGSPVSRPAVRSVTRDTALSAAAGAPLPTTSPITTIERAEDVAGAAQRDDQQGREPEPLQQLEVLGVLRGVPQLLGGDVAHQQRLA